jgi:outer membrane protein TolC
VTRVLQLNRDNDNRDHEFPRRVRVLGTALILLGCMANAAPAAAQTQTPSSLTLLEAIELARKNYPALKEVRARAEGAEAGVGLARTAYVPRLDALWQGNRATRNNVFGLLFPQGIIPAISGPVLGSTTYDSVWGSAAGVLLSWQAVDFGVRKANVEAARAQAAQANAQTALTELDVTAAAADAFVSVLAADEAVRAARANVERLQTFAESVRTLVQNQLRPGADESRADAELAIAQNQLSQAMQTSAIARAVLADAIGSAGTSLTLDVGPLAQLPSLSSTDVPNIDAHPAVRAGAAAIETVQARERALARTYAPRLDLQGAFSGRGTGAEAPGLPPRGNRLGLEVSNWAVGVTVSFPVLEAFAVNARKRIEAQNELAERARHEQAIQTVTTQRTRAQALMTAATEIARNTPVELKAAADAESRARARYASGLASLTEVAEAQRLLAQAEADEAVARLGVWRALLAVTQATGDLTPFLERLRRP